MRWAKTAVARLAPLQPSGDRPLWVFGGSSGAEFTDNSRALFEYVVSVHPEIDAVWLIDADAPDREAIEACGGRWIDRSSLRAFRLTRSAKVVVYSHGIHDVAGLTGNVDGTIVRLGHGLSAFKSNSGALARQGGRMADSVSLAPVASTFEQRHKLEWGFEPHQLPVTGLARWDTMIAARQAVETTDRRFVLIAPTWREWLAEDPTAAGEFWSYIDALGAPDSLAHYARLGLEPVLFTHPIIRHALRRHDTQLRSVHAGSELPGVLARSALVITDYSSLAWDALYLGIPTLFCHFDLDRTVATRRPHIDLRQRLWGPTATTAAELADALASLSSEALMPASFAADVLRWSAMAFDYSGGGNAERIADAILSYRQEH